MNELARETSPYLLQHAQNPVHWKAWNTASLESAKSQNKLIIISIGYSACHWCHVMEHETFEDSEAAEVMNANFISIKIDREERPDIDAVYMKAVQIMTGHGGWPMNVIALPDGRPVWGGTYFRKNDWMNSLEQLSELYRYDPQKMIDYAEKLQNGLQSFNLIPIQNQDEADQKLLEPLVAKWKKSFDWEFGGMARAPKFMLPNNYDFLQRYGFQNNDSELLEFVDLTLTKMAYGGLFDTLGGGFSRYSVDMKWHVPHFEKMLYDNGQLVSLYADAYKRTQNLLYKDVIQKTLDFVSREWLTKDGAFYSALDADSLNANNHLEEGAFYVWTKAELSRLLGGDFELFSVVFNINDFGFWEKENYVLIQNESLETIAKQQNISAADLESKKQSWEKTLFDARENRPKPRLDDKCLTSWNAIMLKGFVWAYKALGDQSYLEIALKNAHFLIQNQWSPEGNLWHSYKNGNSTINGFLEDYAHVIAAFIALYEVTFDEKWLHDARKLTDYCLDNFYDESQQFFSFPSKLDPDLVAPHFEIEDNVIPASNSVMAENLFLLGIYFHQSHYEKLSRQMTLRLVSQVDYPSAFSNWLRLFVNYSDSNKELAICGNDALEFASKINSRYIPQVVLAGNTKASCLPFLEHRYAEGKMLFYLCRDKTCDAPTSDFGQINKDLNKR
jgi:uncharacterized protein YyaL (SSP411 family)